MRRSPLVPIFLIVLVDVLGLTIVIPLLAIYAESFGATPTIASLLIPTFAVCQLLAGPVLGRLSDRHGRRPILLISQFGTLLGFVLLAEARTLWMVFAGRALDGMTAGNLAVAQAYIADHTPPEKRARAFGLIGIAFGLGFLVGPAISGWLAHYDYSAPFWAAACMSAMSIAGTWFLLPRHETPTAEPGRARPGILDWEVYVEYFRRPVLRGVLLQFFVYMIAFTLFTGGFALFAERHLRWDGELFTPREIGFTFAGAGLVGAIVQGGFMGRLVGALGESRLAVVGFCSLGAGYVVLGFADTITLLAVSTALSAFGGSVVRPALTSLVTQLGGRSEQGSVLGMTQALSSIAAICAPPIAGILIEHDLGAAWAWLAAGFAILGALLAPIGTHRAQPRSTDSVASSAGK
ncbi:MAG: MFS transporter [Deltaproteobacteria bacterium]|nr:MFS transporter [Kofleriaceae bacterium]